MHGVLSRNRYTGDPGKREEFFSRTQTEYFALVRQAPGFLDYYSIREASSAITYAVYIWASKAQTEAFVASDGLQAWGPIAQGSGVQRESWEQGEVVGYRSAGVRLAERPMYAGIGRNRHDIDPARLNELTDLFPHLRQAPGFRDYYAIREEGGNLTHAVFIWESQAQAQAFRATDRGQAWSRTVREHGSQLEGSDRGEVVKHLSSRA